MNFYLHKTATLFYILQFKDITTLLKICFFKKVWNNPVGDHGGTILACKKVDKIDRLKSRYLHCGFVSIVFSNCVTNNRDYSTAFKLSLMTLAIMTNNKDSWILFQVPSDAEDFDTTTLEDIMKWLCVILPSSQSRYTLYLERVANQNRKKPVSTHWSLKIWWHQKESFDAVFYT